MRIKDPRIGMVLQERYRVLERIGAGGMGAVYKGEHLKIQKPVAIKFLRQELTLDVESLKRFHREAVAAAAIGHPNIIDVTDMEQDDKGSVYMVLEFLEGHDWAMDIRKTGAQSLSRVVHIMSQILEALTAAHELGIVHRDLKPDNIFLTTRGKQKDFVKVLDFGISKVRDSLVGEGGLTGSGIALGTPYYMSPEQATAAAQVDHRSDIWSVGVMLYESLTGRLPFSGTKISDIVLQICVEPTPPLCTHRPDLPAEVERIVERCLEKEPEQRYESCEALAAELEQLEEALERGTVTAASTVLDVHPPIMDEVADAAVDPMGRTAAIAEPVEESGAGSDESESPPAASSSSSEAVAPRRSVMGFIIGGLLLLLLVGGVLSWGFFRGDDGPTTAAASGTAAPPETPATTEDARVKAGSPAPAESVRVRITTAPEDATLTIDGEVVENPYEQEVPRASAARVITAAAPGFRALHKTVSFDRARALHLELQRRAAKVDRPRAADDSPAKARSESPAVAEAAAEAPTERPTKSDAPAASAATQAPASSETSPEAPTETPPAPPAEVPSEGPAETPAEPANPLSPLQRRGLKRI